MADIATTPAETGDERNKPRSSWPVRIILAALTAALTLVGIYVTIQFEFDFSRDIENLTENVEQVNAAIVQSESEYNDLRTQISSQYNETVENRVDPIPIEGWLVLKADTGYYQVSLDENYPGIASRSEAPATSTQTTTEPPRELPLPDLDDYKGSVRSGTCSEVPGSDPWCFYAGGTASYIAWRINEINFEGVHIFGNTYRMNERPTAPTVWGHAADWVRAARALGLAVDASPAEGSIAHWERRGDDDHGFLAYVEDVSGNSSDSELTLTLSYMNASGQAVSTDPSTWRLRAQVRCSPSSCGTRGWPDNFIHIKDIR